MENKTVEATQTNNTNSTGERKAKLPASRVPKPSKDKKQLMQTVSPEDIIAQPVGELRHVFEEAMELMRPGDILLLDGTQSLRELVDTAFFAILACPLCGKLDLLTQAQYSGTETVICGYDDCTCHFRINGRQEIAYLFVN